jgi:hypothetical protein
MTKLLLATYVFLIVALAVAGAALPAGAYQMAPAAVSTDGGSDE